MKPNRLTLFSSQAAQTLSASFFVLFCLYLTGCQWVDYSPGFIDLSRKGDDNSGAKVIPLKDPVLYWGHRLFSQTPGKPLNETVTISGSDLANFEGCLHLKMKLLDNRAALHNLPMIRIDGQQVLYADDLSKGVSVITKEICGKTTDFTLTVSGQGEQGRQIELWIEGNMKNPIIDKRDGNQYKWVKIGEQRWMAQNLAWLPSLNTPNDSSETQKRYYVYDYTGINVSEAKSSANYKLFGVLYNHPAAMEKADSSSRIPSGVQGACPPGWHLPSWGEFLILRDFLMKNGYNYPGINNAIAKSMAAKTGWDYSETPGTVGNDPGTNNSSGFTGLAGGHYAPYQDRRFFGIGGSCNWWTSSMDIQYSSHDYFINAVLLNTRTYLTRYNTVAWFGYYVRCVRN